MEIVGAYVSEDDFGKRSTCSISLEKNPRVQHLENTHHDQSRGRSPSRRHGCIHCAQPVPISLAFLCLFHFCRLRGRATYVVESAELGRSLVQAGVGREDGAAALPLVSNNPSHGDGVDVVGCGSWRLVVNVRGRQFLWMVWPRVFA